MSKRKLIEVTVIALMFFFVCLVTIQLGSVVKNKLNNIIDEKYDSYERLNDEAIPLSPPTVPEGDEDDD